MTLFFVCGQNSFRLQLAGSTLYGVSDYRATTGIALVPCNPRILRGKHNHALALVTTPRSYTYTLPENRLATLMKSALFVAPERHHHGHHQSSPRLVDGSRQPGLVACRLDDGDEGGKCNGAGLANLAPQANTIILTMST